VLTSLQQVLINLTVAFGKEIKLMRFENLLITGKDNQSRTTDGKWAH